MKTPKEIFNYTKNENMATIEIDTLADTIDELLYKNTVAELRNIHKDRDNSWYISYD